MISLVYIFICLLEFHNTNIQRKFCCNILIKACLFLLSKLQCLLMKKYIKKYIFQKEGSFSVAMKITSEVSVFNKLLKPSFQLPGC